MRNSKWFFWLSFTILILLIIYISVRIFFVLSGQSKIGLVKDIRFIPDTKIVNHRKVVEIMNIKHNLLLYELNLKNLVERIQTIPEIETVSIYRKANNQLIVKIKERQPIAMWKYEDIYYPLDKDGHLIDTPKNEPVMGMYVFIGAQPGNIQEILEIVNSNSILKDNLFSLEWIEERRWDLILKNGIRVKLPENDFVKAIDNLTTMQKRSLILEKDLNIIDMRDLERVIVR